MRPERVKLNVGDEKKPKPKITFMKPAAKPKVKIK
jgi:hypothetical protein